MSRFRNTQVQGHLVGDADTVAFEGDNFLRVIGDDANVFETEVDENLRADPAFVLHHALARDLAVQLPALVKMNLRQHSRCFRIVDGKAAAGVVEIEEDTAIFSSDQFQRLFNEIGAIASD